MERKERKIMVGVDESEESMFGLFLVYHQPYCRHPQRYSSHAILAMEQHGKDLANSVMERAEAICKDFKTTANFNIM
ncbi:hypothetical protein GmHk_03G008638 [Glycine max]|nr:hypothetical protein GmHk_03G008638 [Glycine max]